MYPRIMQIYGPFWVQSYGVMIILGFLVFLLLTYFNKKRREIINDDHYFNTLFIGLVAGVVGGRALFMFLEWDQFTNPWVTMFCVWEGGLVILGTMLGVILALVVYLAWIKVSIFKFLDFIAVYAPLLQSIARIGCFLSGCCYGVECCDCSFHVTFTNPDGLAPLHVPLIPTQLYMSVLSFLIFIVLFLLRNLLNKNGQITFAYLTLDCMARFFIDFYRGDRGTLKIFNFCGASVSLSDIQIWVFVVFIMSFTAFFVASLWNKKQ